MSGIESKFNKAVEIVKALPSDGADKPTQDEQLEFYALFKQATIGDVNTPKPGLLELTAKYKWNAWKSKEGMSQEKAKEEYVEKLRSKLQQSSNPEDAKKILADLDAA
ncbi:hypothetical protein O181_048291 [Austropuccinia psidii MF-1]|uniref:ACB domain-containing protein n=1 Tax=Austropuccinia psidii MF-1 TaxID=1389203 RepID=A0A9Q3DQG8_9BASI|nr:hypothetical protein [Austropuccinia psidii MF-1]